MNLLVKGTSGPLTGEVEVPNSKYHAHRALILASLAPGTSRILGLSDARHVQFTMDVLRALGTKIEVEGQTLLVAGGPYHVKRKVVSVGSSGSTLYFMIGLASLADSPVTLTAQKYFQRRPVGPLLQALSQMGVRVRIEQAVVRRLPFFRGQPRGGKIVIPGTLSQWISGLLLLAPFTKEPTVIEVEGELNERPYIALTAEMMRAFDLQDKDRAGLAALRDRTRTAAASGDARASARHRLGRVRARRDGPSSLGRALSRSASAAWGTSGPSRGRIYGDPSGDGTPDGV